MTNIALGPYAIGQGLRPIVIAEAGINHNGHIDLAREMVHAAKEAGADIIKFQTHIAQAEMLPDVVRDGDAGSHVTRSLFEIMTECELSLDEHVLLKKEAENHGILFLSTPFSVEAVEMLEKLNLPAYKIGSGEVSNIPFIRYVAKKNRPIILSTGTGTLEEIKTAVDTINEYDTPVILMQCTSNYPTPYHEVNLRVIDALSRDFNVPVGLSDHCEGNYACFGAVACGAALIEKHFTLSRKLPGIDQSSSIEPHELADLVAGAKSVYASLGNKKEINEEAGKVRNGFSESVVTIKPVKKGELFAERQNVWVKRPGTGIPSYDLPKVVGRAASRDIAAHSLLSWEDISLPTKEDRK